MGIVGYAARTAVREAARTHSPGPPRPPGDAPPLPHGARGTVAVREPGAIASGGQAGATLPSCSPTDGVKALMNLAKFHTHYDYWDAPEYVDLLAAWEFQCAATGDDGLPIWRALPRLIIAGQAGNGKSGTLDQIAAACGTKVLVECTYPGIRDRIAKDKQTVILDDAQMTFGTTGKASGKVRLMVNTHTKGRVTQDGRNGEQDAYGQMAMAGLSTLLMGKIAFEIADTITRCFVLHKPRKPKGYHVPEVSDAAEAIVREKVVPPMREWCATYRADLRARAAWFGEGNPTGLPDLGGGGRGNDQLARPLLAACDVATALAHKAWREARETGDIAEDAQFPPEWDWSARIRKALIFVSGVPGPVDGEESPLDGVSAEFDRMWAAGDSAEEDILAKLEDADIMAEMQSRTWAQDGAEDEPEGYEPWRSEALDALRASLPPQEPPSPPVPAAEYRAGYAFVPGPGMALQHERLPGSWDTPGAARAACEHHHEAVSAEAGITDPGPLQWLDSPRNPGTAWIAVIPPEDGQYPEASYAVSMTAGK